MNTTTTDRRPRSRGRTVLPATPAASKAPATEPAIRPAVIDVTARLEMISNAAYYLAERRGFGPGHALEDWLAAEREIDLVLAAGAGTPVGRSPGEGGST